MGGMPVILEIIIAHEDDQVRQAASRVFGTITGNNPKVQDFAQKSGACNLAVQLEREKTPLMRESILSSLSSLLKADNFPGKR